MKYCPQCQQNYDKEQRLCPADGHLLSLTDPYHLVGETLLDKYRIDALVGLGGMGAVYSAHQLNINRRVAFKILLPNLALHTPKLAELFEREAITAGQLHHDNIVDVKDAGRTPDGLVYIVMEWLDGRTLEDEIQQEAPLSLERSAELLRQIAAALDHAHARKVVHRDLKPSNIMLVPREDGREQVKIVDFGIAKIISEDTVSPVSRLMGTPHYASPEQFHLGADIDGRADIYSLGIMLFQMLSGRLPFVSAVLQDLIRLQETAPPPPLRQFRPDVPPPVEELLNRMLAKEPHLRPATAAEVSRSFAQLAGALDFAKTPQQLRVQTSENRRAATQHARRPAEDLHSAPTAEQVEREPLHAAPTAPPVSQSALETVAAPTTRKLQLVAENAAAATRQIVPQETAEPVVRPVVVKPPEHRWRAPLLALALLVAAALLYWRWPRETVQPPRTELLSYYLEIGSAQCQKPRRGTGDEVLQPGEDFRFHFTARENGYLYLIAPNEKNVPMTFLTAQPDAKTGVTTNFVAARNDYVFPPGEGNCLGLDPNEKMMAFTLIFSPVQLASPGFLIERAQRELTGTDQTALNQLRRQSAAQAVQVTPDHDRRLSLITALSSENSAPVVIDLFVKHQ